MRLFIAIQLSDEMKKSVISTMHELKKAGVKGSYVPSQNLHVTLAFIGETKDSGAVKDAMKTVFCKPFRMAFTDMGTFDNLLWVPAPKGEMMVKKVSLMKSDLKDGKRVYSEIFSINIEGDK